MDILLFIAIATLIAALAFLILKIRFIKKENDTLIQKLEMSDDKVTELVFEIRDMWDHLPRSLPISSQMKTLAQEIGFGLPYLYATGGFPEDVQSYIDALVKHVNDPVLNELWKCGERKKVLSMLRTILFSPVAPGFTPNSVCLPDGPMMFGLVERRPIRSPAC